MNISTSQDPHLEHIYNKIEIKYLLTILYKKFI